MLQVIRLRNLLMSVALFICSLAILVAQTTKASLRVVVKDAGGAVLQGAKIQLEPAVQPATSDVQGTFLFPNLVPGTYKVIISFVGFDDFTTSVDLKAGDDTHIDATLKVAANKQEVEVYAGRLYGDAEAINRTLAAENILQVLPADVITSLPNANIADALGRMPSVTIERDEGEGKYVQIRGTEPRLSNTMVDGVTIASPESGVRQIKLDTIASDLVDSVEINKTLQANIDGDGIGGSVNLVTKTAADPLSLMLYGLGGHTPIIGGRGVMDTGGTIGSRFLANKKLGVLVGGTYNYNGRGINDLEPVPTAGDATPHYSSQDFRDYIYNRTRWGTAGSVDYQLNPGSNIAFRALFSTFRNWGNKWVYTLMDGAAPAYSQDWRRPNMAILSGSLQGRHNFNSNSIMWNLAAGRSRSLSGSGGANFQWMGDPGINCLNDQSRSVSVYRPGWSTGCFGTGADNAFDRNNYGFNEFDYPTFGQSAQVNLMASGSYARTYHFGSHFGTFELGAKIRNAHKYDNTYNSSWFAPQDANGNYIPVPIAQHPEWYGSFTDPQYYDKTYGPYPAITDWGKLKGWVQSNESQLVFSGGPGPNSNNYDLIETIPAGYIMNTIELTPKIRLVAGLRIEHTNVNTTSFDETTNALDYKAGGDYINWLPSASLRFGLDHQSDLRLVYGRGLARPDPQDLSAAVGQPTLNQVPVTISIGNPALKAELANDYDALYERNLNPLGLIQAGYFYKDLTLPIVNEQFYSTATYPHVPPGTNVLVSQPINAGSGYVQGVEFAFQQRLSYLPGVLGGAGISANYSYTTSKARDLPNRSDQPALQRQAPNSWNIGPTYDTKKFSMRVGMSFDDRMIYQYNWVDGADSVGIHGPSGDVYLYPHFQFDAQASYSIPWGLQIYAYGLNLNNEVFGFYQGSGQYMIQREYYHPTYAAGLRWTMARER